MTMAAAKKINVFIGYHSVDEALKTRLLDHLSVLQRLYDIVVEHEVTPGSHISETVERQLCAADMILLLLTGDFLGSDQHFRQVIEPAITKSKNNESVVIPVILRSCLWKVTELAKMDVLPENGQAVEEWQVKDSGYRSVATEIMHRIEKLKAALELRQLKKENERLTEEIAALKKSK